MMPKKPFVLHLLVLLWLIFSSIFLIFAYYSFEMVLNVLEWSVTNPSFYDPMVFFSYLMFAISMLVFGVIFIIFAYETYKGRKWVWNAGIIFSTIFLVIFGFLMMSLMITALVFMDTRFSIPMLIAVMVAFLTDLGIIFFVTRPQIKAYMHSPESNELSSSFLSRLNDLYNDEYGGDEE